jgi:hypothetical protein
MQKMLDFTLRIAERFALLFREKHREVLNFLFHHLDALQDQLGARFGRGLGPG